jgi:uncharacterized repeat protein (TIGR01451 family)
MKTLKFLVIGMFIVMFSLQSYAGEARNGKFTDPCTPGEISVYHIGDPINFKMYLWNTDVVNLIVTGLTDTYSDGTLLPISPPVPPPDIIIPPDGRVDWTTSAVVTSAALTPTVAPPYRMTVQNIFDIVAYHNQGGVPDPYLASPSASAVVLRPDICVTKTADPTFSKVGDTVTYTIEICNCGDANLALTDISDTQLSFIDIDWLQANHPECMELERSQLDENGDIIPDSGGCCSFQVDYTIQQDDLSPLVNEVCVTAEDELGGPAGTVTDCDIAVVDLVVPCISITKECEPTTASVGDVITYTITISNCSTQENGIALENVVVTDTLLGVLTEFPTTLAIGDSNEQVYTRTILPTDPCPLINTATVEATVIVLGNPVDANDSCEVNCYEPCTTVDIKANDSDGPITVCEGEEVTLTICEENCGDVNLTDVHVDVTYDEGSGELPLGTLIAPPDSGDDGDNVLEPGENWCWSGPVIVDVNTVFGATGYGTDPSGNVITYPDDPNEYDEVEVLTEPCGGEGCTPGFWKNNAANWGASAWVGFLPSDSFEAIFGVDVTLRGKGKNTYPTPTLLDALNANGGGINALARHAVAALLNTSSPCVNYPYANVGALITAVHDAIVAGDTAIQELHSDLAYDNEAGCPISQHQQGDQGCTD